MFRPLAFALSVCALFAVLCPAPAVRVEPEIADGTLAVTNVTVIDVVAGRSVPGQTVIVRGDAIAHVGPSKAVAVNGETPVIDGTGKFLIPGLWDMHAHLADNLMPPLFLHFGVTGVRHMYSPIRGIDLKPEEPAKERASPTFPRVVAARNLIDGERTDFPRFFRGNILYASNEQEARDAVKEAIRRENDFIKVHSLLDREAYFAVAKEAKARKLPFAGHVPLGVTAAEASDAGQLTIEHLDGIAVLCSKQSELHQKQLAAYAALEIDKRNLNTRWKVQRDALETFDPDKGAALFKKFVRNGTWHTPTLVESGVKLRLADPKALAPEVEKLLPPSAKKMWAREFRDGSVHMPQLGRSYTPGELAERKVLFAEEVKLLAAMHKAGVRLLAGTDTPNVLVVPGLALHEELEIFTRSGLTPAEALRTATVNPAECLKLRDKYGTVETGKCADLVLLTKNPLDDIRNTTSIDKVIMGGCVVKPLTPAK